MSSSDENEEEGEDEDDDESGEQSVSEAEETKDANPEKPAAVQAWRPGFKNK